MLRHIAAVLPAALLVGSLAAQTDPVVASRAAYQEAVAAYKARDLAGFLRSATEASRLRPTHGGALYALASAHALLGDTTAAVAALRRFAALGYTADLAADSDFVGLNGAPALLEVRDALARNAAPLAAARPAFTLAERDLLTEGIAYDPGARALFVGSVHRRKILRVDAKGGVTEFVPPETGGLWAPLGMRVDAARRCLWVASTAVPQMLGYAAADSFRSGLFRFDLQSGKPTGRFPVPDDGEPHALGDVVVSRAGDVYATDSRSPRLYRVRSGADSLEVFLESSLLLSGQGLALDPDERSLYVADYARGILHIDLATRGISLVPAPDDVLALGIDGLYQVGGTLIGIQNGITPHRVARFTLDPTGTRIASSTVLERARPDYAEPTLGVVVDRELFYVANSQWERFRDDGGIDAPAELRPPLVLRLRL
jgi:SMP-30/gluconolaconase/LRE-like protein